VIAPNVVIKFLRQRARGSPRIPEKTAVPTATSGAVADLIGAEWQNECDPAAIIWRMEDSQCQKRAFGKVVKEIFIALFQREGVKHAARSHRNSRIRIFLS
jgi:hypothetical protein